jgi:hypothetical protein
VGPQRPGELSQQFGMPTGPQSGVVAIELDGKPFGLKGSSDVVHPWGVDRREWLTTPQRQRAVEYRRGVGRIGGCAGLRREVAEAVQIDRQRIGHQLVTARLADDLHVGTGEQLTQPRHVGGDRIATLVRRFVRPHPIDELIHGDRMFDVDKKGDENTPLTDVPDFEALPVDSCLDVAEQSEFGRHGL